MTESEALAQASSALDAIDTATSAAGSAVTSIQARIDDLLAQIAANPDSSAEITSLAERAQGISATLGPVAEALNAMGQPANPVPIPVPEPVEG